MTKSELEKKMKQTTGGLFITRKGLADIMGIKDPKNVTKYLINLDRVDGKYYFIPDVAEEIVRRV